MVKVANTQNLKPIQKGELSSEEAKRRGSIGGIASGKARKQKAMFKDSLQKILASNIKIPTIDPNKPIKMDKDILNLLEKLESIGVNTKELPLIDLITLGQILGAIGGRSENYRTLIEVNGDLLENESNELKLTTIDEIVDNSNLKKVLYEENKPRKTNEK